MSNASDPKVEDVLSSVRRLVSNELPRTPRPDLPRGASALVLTDAQRVAAGPVATPSEKSLETRIAELEAAVGDQQNEFEPDGSEDQDQHQPDRIVYTRPPSHKEVASRMARRLSQIALIETAPGAEDPEVIADASPSFRHVTEPVPEAPMAEDVPTERRTSADVAAFSDPDDMAANIDARIASGRPVTEPLQLLEPQKVPDQQTVVPSEDVDNDDFDAALTAAVRASIAASDETGAAQDDTADDAGLAVGDFGAPHFDVGTTDPEITAAEMLSEGGDGSGPDRVEAAVSTVAGYAERGQTTQTHSLETADPPTDQTLTDEGAEAPAAAAAHVAEAALEALPDEEAMRLLVSRMIRDELQGELGQHMTRSLRKLVRREIKRALGSKDLT